MPFAVELLLDERSDQRVRQIWAALDEQGITSPGGIPGSEYRPHVSLTVFEDGDPGQVAEVLRPLLRTAGWPPLPLASLGFFLTAEAVAFLGVVPTARLLSLHHIVHEALERIVEGINPYYHPDALVPHCTLAIGVPGQARVAGVVSRFRLPVPAVAASAHITEIGSGGLRRTRIC
ncbi:MAG: 2'-5' RNA ligase family protein [Actinobacteria bacterium]|nr:2'-5' RNA ligase family protein [Actinomycetota bacterium]